MRDGLQLLLLELREFSSKRDWDQFHSPKKSFDGFSGRSRRVIGGVSVA